MPDHLPDHLPAAPATAFDYIRDGAEIYRKSFAIIRAEADLNHIPPDLEKLAVRMAHASGMVDIIADLTFSTGAGEAGRRALAGGAAILCDSTPLSRGVTRARLPADNAVLALDESLSLMHGLEAWHERIGGSVVAIGTRGDVLKALLALVTAGWPRPALILGFPVAVDGADSGKSALEHNRQSQAFVTLHGTRGGSAMAAAAINALASEQE